MKNYNDTHIEGIYPGETLCEIRIVKGLGRKKIKVVKYPDHPADCAECLTIWAEDQELKNRGKEYKEGFWDPHGNSGMRHMEECDTTGGETDCTPPPTTEYFTKRRRGRPAKGDAARDQVKPIRWTAENWSEVEAAAQLAGMTPSAFIRGAVLSQARSIRK